MTSPLSWAAVLLVVIVLVIAWVRRIPLVMALAIANFCVFILTATTGLRLTIIGSPLMDDLAARVSYLTDQDWAHAHTILTSTILHANVLHVVMNMLVLLMFGLPFEDRVGRGRFLTIYVGSAIVAVLLHGLWIVKMAPESLEVPLVGASGAVFGIIAAFATMYPRDQIPMFLVFIMLQRVPVWIGAAVMLSMQAIAIVAVERSGVAYAAHIGGAVGGFLFALVLKPKVKFVSEARSAPTKLDYAVLDRLATEPAQKKMVGRLRENEDSGDVQRAWLERLLPSLACPRCGCPFEAKGRGRLACENGHEERYAT